MVRLMILVLSEPGDFHADYVEQLLRQRGVSFARFAAREYPSRTAISVAFESATRGSVLRRQRDVIDLEKVHSVWLRRPGRPHAHASLSDQQVQLAVEQESEAFLTDLWESLNVDWVPGPPSALVRWHKTAQLTLALKLGFDLPPTLVTNDPTDALEFYRRHDGQVVSKRAGFSWVTEAASPFRRYTEVVTTRDIANVAEIRYCPLILQAYVPKALELRVTVVDSAVFAAEIHSQHSNHTRHDWRRYDHTRCVHRPHLLPGETEDRCRRIVHEMGLTFGAIDMILTPDGRYVFLEVNTNGQYLWIELATGLPISEAICDLLVKSTESEASTGERKSLHGSAR